MRLPITIAATWLTLASAAKAHDTVEAGVAQFRAHRAAEAVETLHALAEDRDLEPADRSRARYYLARSLRELGLLHSAELALLTVMESGPEDPYFRYAIPGLLDIAHQTGDPEPMLGVVDLITVEEQPPRAQPTLHYLQGLAAWQRNHSVRANKLLGLVPDSGDLYPRARYLQGLILLEHGKQKSATGAFQDVVRASTEGDRREREQLAELQAKATLQLGRLYDDLGDRDQAESFYAQVERGSRSWPEALEAMARIDLAQGEPSSALKRSAAASWQTIPASAPRADAVPRVAEILHAQALRTLCRPAEAKAALDGFEARAMPAWTQLAAATTAHRDEDGAWRDPGDAWEAWVDGVDGGAPRMERSIVQAMVDRGDLIAPVLQLSRLQDERSRLEMQLGTGRDQLARDLAGKLEDQATRTRTDAGVDLLEAMASLEAELSTLLQLAEAERAVLAEDAPCESHTPGPQGPDPDAWGSDAAEDETTWTWPFTGEIWADEL